MAELYGSAIYAIGVQKSNENPTVAVGSSTLGFSDKIG